MRCLQCRLPNDSEMASTTGVPAIEWENLWSGADGLRWQILREQGKQRGITGLAAIPRSWPAFASYRSSEVPVNCQRVPDVARRTEGSSGRATTIFSPVR